LRLTGLCALVGGTVLALAACGSTSSGGTADAAGNAPSAGTPSVSAATTQTPNATVSKARPTASPSLPGPAAVAPVASGGSGFWTGSDSWPIPVAGGAPYTTPGTGGVYGGYVGMTGNWARWLGCGTGNFLAWSDTNSKQADINKMQYGKGIGTAVYWYMGGPGVDPGWNGTAAEARAWGAKQAAAALASLAYKTTTYPVLFMDIEMPGIAPAPDNGWTTVYTSPCSGMRRSGVVTAEVARAEFDGFADYLTRDSNYKTGVYSDPVTWTQIFGSGSAAQIPHTYEWTYEPETANLGAAPQGWCLKNNGGCAQFFGGVSAGSRYAVMWQWSGGGGVRNALGDFDQIAR
jgi:hypothetical protein